jgi:hypothetical protein
MGLHLLLFFYYYLIYLCTVFSTFLQVPHIFDPFIIRLVLYLNILTPLSYSNLFIHRR